MTRARSKISVIAMPDIWYVIALQVIALVGGMLAGAVALAIGGAGGIRMLSKRLEIVENHTDDLGSRITKEVKSRAGTLGAAARKTSDADLLAQVHEANAASQAPPAGKRPSPLALRGVR